jgi:hypothetical protein
MRRAIVRRQQLGRNEKVPDISVRMRRGAARAGQSSERERQREHAMHKQLLASITLAAIVGVPSPSAAQDIPAEYQQVLSMLGKQGDYKDNVLKVNIPRSDVIVFLHYWGTGPADSLARGFKAAVDELGTHGAASTR